MTGQASEMLADLKQRYAATVIFVYLCEAQGFDSWPLSVNAPKNHTSVEERWAAGERLLQKYPGFAQQVDAWFVDDMDDGTTIANGFWPERYLVVATGRVTWASTIAEATDSNMPQNLATATAAAFAAKAA